MEIVESKLYVCYVEATLRSYATATIKITFTCALKNSIDCVV